MQFKNIIGQNSLKQKLAETVNHGKFGHAQLFLGKDGYGALALAIAYAQYIFCQNKNNNDSCGQCDTCKKVQKASHPDLHFSFPVNGKDASKLIADDFLPAWREMLSESAYFERSSWYQKIDVENKQGNINVAESKNILKKLSLKSFEGSYKILIIWHAENMGNEASNRMLKLIEEPAEKTLLFLVAEEREQLLTTITSRTQIINIPPIEKTDIEEHLIQKGIDSKEAEQAANWSSGDLILAYERVQQSEENEEFFELFAQWMRVSYKANIAGIYDWVEHISSASFGREKRKRFIQYALDKIRLGMLSHYSEGQIPNSTAKETTFLKNFAPFVHGANIIDMYHTMNEAQIQIERNAYPKILFMDLSMQFANLLHVKTVHL